MISFFGSFRSYSIGNLPITDQSNLWSLKTSCAWPLKRDSTQTSSILKFFDSAIILILMQINLTPMHPRKNFLTSIFMPGKKCLNAQLGNFIIFSTSKHFYQQTPEISTRKNFICKTKKFSKPKKIFSLANPKKFSNPKNFH